MMPNEIIELMTTTVLVIFTTRVYEKNPEQLKKLIASEEEPSLSDLVQVKLHAGYLGGAQVNLFAVT